MVTWNQGPNDKKKSGRNILGRGNGSGRDPNVSLDCLGTGMRPVWLEQSERGREWQQMRARRSRESDHGQKMGFYSKFDELLLGGFKPGSDKTWICS